MYVSMFTFHTLCVCVYVLQELTVVEDCTGSTHTVNPLMVHVLVTSPSQGDEVSLS